MCWRMWTILLFVGFFFFSANTELSPPDLVDISCVDGLTAKVVYRYPVDRPPNNGTVYVQPLQYEAKDSIYGDLAQNIKIDGTGDCYDLFIRFR